MWSISPIDRPAEDLDIRRTTKSQDASLDSRSGQQGGRRRRRRARGSAVEDAIEVDVFEPHSDEESEA